MIVSKTFKNTGEIYLKTFKGKASNWTSERKNAHKFKTKKQAQELADLHSGKAIPNS